MSSTDKTKLDGISDTKNTVGATKLPNQYNAETSTTTPSYMIVTIGNNEQESKQSYFYDKVTISHRPSSSYKDMVKFDCELQVTGDLFLERINVGSN